MQGSANLNIMMKAARKAGRSLVKDFREVENLQVSSKGPGDFVSRADTKAEQIIRDELTKARPNYGWLAEESAAVKGADPTRRDDCTRWRRRARSLRPRRAGTRRSRTRG